VKVFEDGEDDVDPEHCEELYLLKAFIKSILTYMKGGE
jgi:hypothetical protein